MTSVKDSYDLLRSPGTEVPNVIFPNDDVVWVSWKHSEDNSRRKNVNVAVAAYKMTQSLLKLYEYLSELGESVLYCDTDSVIFIQNVDEPPKLRTGDYLGHLTDELVEFGALFFIEVFVSRGLKKYAFSVFYPSNKNIPPNAK